MTAFTESIVEQAALAWFESLGWSIRHGLEIAPGEPGAGRENGVSRNVVRSTDVGKLDMGLYNLFKIRLHLRAPSTHPIPVVA